MNTISKKVIALSLILLAFSLNSCAELFDCVASARPDIHGKNLATGTVGGNYNDFLDSDVTNDPNDNAYDYYYSVSGTIPPGMTYNQQGRKLYFSGIPSQAGSYTFRVHLKIDYPDSYDPNQGFFEDGNRICFGDDSTSKEFTISIQ